MITNTICFVIFKNYVLQFDIPMYCDFSLFFNTRPWQANDFVMRFAFFEALGGLTSLSLVRLKGIIRIDNENVLCWSKPTSSTSSISKDKAIYFELILILE